MSDVEIEKLTDEELLEGIKVATGEYKRRKILETAEERKRRTLNYAVCLDCGCVLTMGEFMGDECPQCGEERARVINHDRD